jgi:RNA-directed DNA polymerase
VRSRSAPNAVTRQALAQVLGPRFEPGFSRFSYGFRPRRGAHDAVRQARDYLKEGYAVAVDMDLAKFFDSVNFDVLMRRGSAQVPDLSVRRLIWRYLRAGVVENGQWSSTEQGVPQGGPLSPLPAHIVLHDLDMELEKQGCQARPVPVPGIHVSTQEDRLVGEVAGAV